MKENLNNVKLAPHFALIGQAADIRPCDPAKFQLLVDFLKRCEHTDQLLTGNDWLHILWNPFAQPHHYIHLGYYG